MRVRQEGIQATSQGVGSVGWELSSSGGFIPGSPPSIVGGPDPHLPSILSLGAGDFLEGWMHFVVPVEGGVEASWNPSNRAESPHLVVRLRRNDS